MSEPKTIETQAARDVLAERTRQTEREGWTVEHDDAHRTGQLAQAAACYALASNGSLRDDLHDELWPWDQKWWKPYTARRDLVRAAALLLAEIERIDRRG
jgi:hypothetical protein